MKRDEMLSYTAEDISKMNKKELLELARAEQKAIKDARYRLQNAEINSPALRQIQEVGNISAKKSMTVNQLRHEVTKGRVLLNYETITVGRAREVENEIIGALANRIHQPELTKEQSKTLWKVIDKLREADNKALLNTSDLRKVSDAQYKVYALMKKHGFMDETDDDDIDKLQSIVENALERDYQARQGLTVETEDYNKLMQG